MALTPKQMQIIKDTYGYQCRDLALKWTELKIALVEEWIMMRLIPIKKKAQILKALYKQKKIIEQEIQEYIESFDQTDDCFKTLEDVMIKIAKHYPISLPNVKAKYYKQAIKLSQDGKTFEEIYTQISNDVSHKIAKAEL